MVALISLVAMLAALALKLILTALHLHRQERQWLQEHAGPRFVYKPGCDQPYDYQAAIAAKLRADHRERAKRRLEANQPSSQGATVVSIRRGQ